MPSQGRQPSQPPLSPERVAAANGLLAQRAALLAVSSAEDVAQGAHFILVRDGHLAVARPASVEQSAAAGGLRAALRVQRPSSPSGRRFSQQSQRGDGGAAQCPRC